MAPREATYIAITQLPIHFVAIGILIFLVALGQEHVDNFNIPTSEVSSKTAHLAHLVRVMDEYIAHLDHEHMALSTLMWFDSKNHISAECHTHIVQAGDVLCPLHALDEPNEQRWN